jgi:single-strand DNA-binding protein
MTYQQITLVGNVGRDPELRYTPQGTAVCDVNVAVNRSYKGADGQRNEETTWFRVTCWNQLAETVANYVKKGKQILVVGEVSARAYTAKDGTNAVSLEVRANTVRFLGTRGDGDGGGSGRSDYDDEDFSPPNRGGGNRGGNRGGGAPAESSDDIPF